MAISSFIIAVVIGIVDFLTGYELAFSLFYLFPIFLATWYAGRRIGLILSIASAFIWFAADVKSGHVYSHQAIIYWNTCIRFGFFIIVTLLLSALKTAHEQVTVLSRTDCLTGAANSRYFFQLVQWEIDRSKRNNKPLTLAYVDLDNFKTVNDNYGHPVGDRVLDAVVHHIKEQMRKTDVVARMGGDEFAILLTETDEAAAQLTINKVQIKLLEEMRRNKWPITFSIGVLTCINLPKSAEELIKQADNLMYAVKNKGKNSINYSIY